MRSDVPSIGVAAVALGILYQGRIGAAWLIAGGAGFGVLRLALGLS